MYRFHPSSLINRQQNNIHCLLYSLDVQSMCVFIGLHSVRAFDSIMPFLVFASILRKTIERY